MSMVTVQIYRRKFVVITGYLENLRHLSLNGNFWWQFLKLVSARGHEPAAALRMRLIFDVCVSKLLTLYGSSG